MFTSVTKTSLRRHFWTLMGFILFSVVFTYVYELFSYGESSPYMRFMFLAPLTGALAYLLTSFGLGWLRNRGSILLFNSALATVVSACLVKGIVEVSGRTTTVDNPYWYVALGFLVLSLGVGLMRRPIVNK